MPKLIGAFYKNTLTKFAVSLELNKARLMSEFLHKWV